MLCNSLLVDSPVIRHYKSEPRTSKWMQWQEWIRKFHSYTDWTFSINLPRKLATALKPILGNFVTHFATTGVEQTRLFTSVNTLRDCYWSNFLHKPKGRRVVVWRQSKRKNTGVTARSYFALRRMHMALGSCSCSCYKQQTLICQHERDAVSKRCLALKCSVETSATDFFSRTRLRTTISGF
jgi:hypothetical protein